MRTTPRSLSARALALPLLALALVACAGNASNDPPPAEARTALPPPEMAPPAAPASEASAAPAGEVDYSCTTDADCAVKDVGSCCGYSPACVNADSQTFPEQVKAACAQNDMMSTCGFREIDGCACVAGRCEAGPATSGEAVR